MSIINRICENCSKSGICKWQDKIDVFSKDAKKRVGVEIEIKSCEEYELIK